MAKKRKAGGESFGQTREDEPVNTKLRIDTYEDVAASEDEFHLNRDKILLDEGPAQKRQRKLREQGALVYSTSFSKSSSIRVGICSH